MKGRRRYQRSLSPWLILSLNSNADFQFDHERAYKCIKTRERRAGRESAWEGGREREQKNAEIALPRHQLLALQTAQSKTERETLPTVGDVT